jgi:hypothetical protein
MPNQIPLQQRSAIEIINATVSWQTEDTGPRSESPYSWPYSIWSGYT